MKIIFAVAAFSIIASSILLIFLSRNGLFAPVNISERKTGPYLLVFEKHIGDYRNVGPVMDRLYFDLRDNYGIATTKGFGLYYDNPQVTDRAALRSIAGCIVEGKSIKDLGIIRGRYKVSEFPLSESVATDFPYRGKISIIFGVIKVYPKLGEYIGAKKYPQNPVMEIYDQPNEKIHYISAIDLPREIYDALLNQ